MMQKVWVLERWTYDNRDIIGMFFSEDTAKEAQAIVKERLPASRNEYAIVDFDVYYEINAWRNDPEVQYRMRYER